MTEAERVLLRKAAVVVDRYTYNEPPRNADLMELSDAISTVRDERIATEAVREYRSAKKEFTTKYGEPP